MSAKDIAEKGVLLQNLGEELGKLKTQKSSRLTLADLESNETARAVLDALRITNISYSDNAVETKIIFDAEKYFGGEILTLADAHNKSINTVIDIAIGEHGQKSGSNLSTSVSAASSGLLSGNNLEISVKFESESSDPNLAPPSDVEKKWNAIRAAKSFYDKTKGKFAEPEDNARKAVNEMIYGLFEASETKIYKDTDTGLYTLSIKVDNDKTKSMEDVSAAMETGLIPVLVQSYMKQARELFSPDLDESDFKWKNSIKLLTDKTGIVPTEIKVPLSYDPNKALEILSTLNEAGLYFPQDKKIDLIDNIRTRIGGSEPYPITKENTEITEEEFDSNLGGKEKFATILIKPLHDEPTPLIAERLSARRDKIKDGLINKTGFPIKDRNGESRIVWRLTDNGLAGIFGPLNIDERSGGEKSVVDALEGMVSKIGPIKETTNHKTIGFKNKLHEKSLDINKGKAAKLGILGAIGATISYYAYGWIDEYLKEESAKLKFDNGEAQRIYDRSVEFFDKRPHDLSSDPTTAAAFEQAERIRPLLTASLIEADQNFAAAAKASTAAMGSQGTNGEILALPYQASLLIRSPDGKGAGDDIDRLVRDVNFIETTNAQIKKLEEVSFSDPGLYQHNQKLIGDLKNERDAAVADLDKLSRKAYGLPEELPPPAPDPNVVNLPDEKSDKIYHDLANYYAGEHHFDDPSSQRAFLQADPYVREAMGELKAASENLARLQADENASPRNIQAAESYLAAKQHNASGLQDVMQKMEDNNKYMEEQHSLAESYGGPSNEGGEVTKQSALEEIGRARQANIEFQQQLRDIEFEIARPEILPPEADGHHFSEAARKAYEDLYIMDNMNHDFGSGEVASKWISNSDERLKAMNAIVTAEEHVQKAKDGGYSPEAQANAQGELDKAIQDARGLFKLWDEIEKHDLDASIRRVHIAEDQGVTEFTNLILGEKTRLESDEKTIDTLLGTNLREIETSINTEYVPGKPAVQSGQGAETPATPGAQPGAGAELIKVDRPEFLPELRANSDAPGLDDLTNKLDNVAAKVDSAFNRVSSLDKQQDRLVDDFRESYNRMIDRLTDMGVGTRGVEEARDSIVLDITRGSNLTSEGRTVAEMIELAKSGKLDPDDNSIAARIAREWLEVYGLMNAFKSDGKLEGHEIEAMNKKLAEFDTFIIKIGKEIDSEQGYIGEYDRLYQVIDNPDPAKTDMVSSADKFATLDEHVVERGKIVSHAADRSSDSTDEFKVISDTVTEGVEKGTKNLAQGLEGLAGHTRFIATERSHGEQYVSSLYQPGYDNFNDQSKISKDLADDTYNLTKTTIGDPTVTGDKFTGDGKTFNLAELHNRIDQKEADLDAASDAEKPIIKAGLEELEDMHADLHRDVSSHTSSINSDVNTAVRDYGVAAEHHSGIQIANADDGTGHDTNIASDNFDKLIHAITNNNIIDTVLNTVGFAGLSSGDPAIQATMGVGTFAGMKLYSSLAFTAGITAITTVALTKGSVGERAREAKHKVVGVLTAPQKLVNDLVQVSEKQIKNIGKTIARKLGNDSLGLEFSDWAKHAAIAASEMGNKKDSRRGMER